MKPRTKFFKMYNQIPEKARQDLVWKPYNERPMTIQIVDLEIRQKTALGDKLLEEMGFTEGSAE